MTTVYVVWDGEYENVYIVGIYGNRDAAEAYIAQGTESLRRSWEALKRKAGTVKEGTGIRQKQPDGSFITLPKYHPDPPGWEGFLQQHGKPWIEEHELLDK